MAEYPSGHNHLRPEGRGPRPRGINNGSLYLVISEEYGNLRTAAEIAAAAISGGADILQLREKKKSAQEILKIGETVSALCRDSGVTFIVNDDPLLARRIGADGVHLGQEDIERFSIEKARDVIGRDRIIGVSTHSLDQLKRAADEDVDYIAFGPIFPTKTKSYSIGTGDISRAMESSRKPIFFIGGIDLSNMESVLSMGARNIALIRGIMEADDMSAMTRQFKEKLGGGKEVERV